MPHSPSSAVRAPRGFTIIEVVVIIIIIALMLVIVIPHYFSEQKAAKAKRVKNDLVTLNSAIEHYALDNGKVSGVHPTYADISKYLDPKSDIYRHEGRDIFGDAYGPFTVGDRPTVPEKTASRLSEVVGEDFWSPFQ